METKETMQMQGEDERREDNTAVWEEEATFTCLARGASPAAELAGFLGEEEQMDWHKELEGSLEGQGDASLYDPAQYSAQLLQVKSPTPCDNLQKIRQPF